MKIVTLSSKNQITVPKALLILIGMQPKGKFLIERCEKEIRLKPMLKSITEQTAASLSKVIPTDKRGKTMAEIMQKTKKITATKLAGKK